MQKKVVATGAVVLLVMAGLYMIGQNSRKIEIAPPPTPTDATDTVTARELPGIPPECPSTVNAIRLTFEDTHTAATHEVIAAYDEIIMEGQFADQDKSRLIQYIDLNKNGRKDFITLHTNRNWCGTLGCATDIFIQNEDGGYDGIKGFHVHKDRALMLESTINGFRQAISPVRYGGLPNQQDLWEWTGEGYETDKHCMLE